MLLGNALLRIFDSSSPYKVRDVIGLFLDNQKTPKTVVPFGIHAICDTGRLIMGKEPGDWYGVNSIA